MTDFKAILTELEASGMSQLEIANTVEAGVSTLCELKGKAGRQPRYPLGARLVQLHAERVLRARPKRRKAA